MKSNALDHIDGERYYLTCACTSPNHLIAFDFFPDIKKEEDTYETLNASICSIYIVSNWHQPLFQRIKMALKFIFFKKEYVVNDFSFGTDQFPAFKEIVDVLERSDKNNKLTVL